MTALNSSKKNLIIILVIVFTLMLILCIRLGWVQIVKGSKYSELAVEQQTKDTPIEAKRGVIYDTNGNELAVSVTCYTIWARPADGDRCGFPHLPSTRAMPIYIQPAGLFLFVVGARF